MGPDHGRRRAFCNRPVHVTMRMRQDVGVNLRQGKVWQHVRAVLRKTREHLGCRIVHFAVLGNHLHLIVEAADDAALRAAMKGFAVRMARRVNACLTCPLRGEPRKGQVFAFRYDTHVLDKPLEARRVILYVLNNAKKHAAESGRRLDRFWLDPHSSAPYFDGWIPEAEIWLARPGGDDDLAATPRHWLLTTGWRKHGLLDPGELPKLRARPPARTRG